MADNKKYFWLKLKENFFEDDIISYLMEQENGSKYVVFYLMLCLKSLKTNGVLIRNVGNLQIPYDAKKLSEITGMEIDTVAVAMNLFQKIGIVSADEIGAIKMANLSDMVGSETKKAEIMRKSRAKKKEAIEGGNNVTPMLPDCGNNVDTEIDIDIEIDKEIELRDRVKSVEIDTEIDNQSASSSSSQLNTSQSTEAIPNGSWEVWLYAISIGDTLRRSDDVCISYDTCQRFYDYYDKKGWTKGTKCQKITDWREQFRYWISREAEK